MPDNEEYCTSNRFGVIFVAAMLLQYVIRTGRFGQSSWDYCVEGYNMPFLVSIILGVLNILHDDK